MTNELHYADDELTTIKGDLWRVLNALPDEVGYLRQAIVGGRIDGDMYLEVDNSCGCLKGSLALGKGIEFKDVKSSYSPYNVNASKLTELLGVTCDLFAPIEQFTVKIHKDDTPATNPYSAQLLAWVDQWLAEREYIALDDAFGARMDGLYLRYGEPEYYHADQRNK